MAIFTMSSILQTIPITAQLIQRSRYGLKVKRIDATARPAQVIHFETHGNRIKEKCKTIAVPVYMLLTNTVLRITIGRKTANPQPASRVWFDRNLISKTRRERVKINTFHSHPHGSRETAMGAISL